MQIKVENAIDEVFLRLLEINRVIVLENRVTPYLAITNVAEATSRVIETLADVTRYALSQVAANNLEAPFPTQAAIDVMHVIVLESGSQESKKSKKGESAKRTAEPSERSASGANESKFEDNENLGLMIDVKQNEVKHKKKRLSISQCENLAYDPDDILLAKDWLKFAQARMPWKEFNEDVFLASIDKVRRSINVNSVEMRKIFEWITNNHFWRENAISPNTLFKKHGKSDMRKIDNILIQMKSQIMKGNQVLLAEEKTQYEKIDDDWNPFTEL